MRVKLRKHCWVLLSEWFSPGRAALVFCNNFSFIFIAIFEKFLAASSSQQALGGPQAGRRGLGPTRWNTLDWSAAHPQAEALRANFGALYLLDSTSFDCPATLQHLFPACGGAGSAANVMVLLRYELIAGRLEPLQVLAGKRSDQGLALQAVDPRTGWSGRAWRWAPKSVASARSDWRPFALTPQARGASVRACGKPCANEAGLLRPKPSKWPAGSCC
jgi:hypothetical protein